MVLEEEILVAPKVVEVDEQMESWMEMKELEEEEVGVQPLVLEGSAALQVGLEMNIQVDLEVPEALLLVQG